MTLLRRLWDRDGLAVDFAPGAGPDLVIAFASAGADAGRAPAPEFVGAARAKGGAPRAALFVTDATRSWGRHPGLPGALEAGLAAAALPPGGRRLGIGLSMGAVAALVAAPRARLDAVLAFGPQAAIGPASRRWRTWAAELPGELPTPLPDPGRTWVCLCHGLQDDAAEAAGFAPAPGRDHLVFGAQSHASLVPHLKARGVMAGLVAAMLANDRRRLLRLLQGAGGQRLRAPPAPPHPPAPPPP